MHNLQRTPEPIGLSHYRYGIDQWSNKLPTSVEKTAIWGEINTMQGNRCAYCEAELDQSKRHIEHFYQRSRYPQGTFSWPNLFGSCNRDESCGKHKDNCDAYNQSDLIKPDIEDPEYFFLFISDGTIAIRGGLNLAEQNRAKETLRIFNLNPQMGPLRYMRQQAIAGYIQLGEELSDLATLYPEHEWLPLLHSEIAATIDLPFSTAIKHTLLP